MKEQPSCSASSLLPRSASSFCVNGPIAITLDANSKSGPTPSVLITVTGHPSALPSPSRLVKHWPTEPVPTSMCPSRSPFAGGVRSIPMDSAEIEKLAAVEERHWWYRERRAVLERLLGTIDSPGRALDIGAACGGNTRVLQKYGWQATALDFSSTGPMICRQRGVPAIRADATRLPHRSGSMDLVIAYDILEHIGDDGAVAREVHRVLKPGGRFLVAVPADPTLWSVHDEAVGHCRRYTASALRSILSESQFEVARLWNWNVLIRPVLKAHRDRISGSDLDHPPALLNALMTQVIRLERHLPLSKLPGISLFVEARSVAHQLPSKIIRSDSIAATSPAPSRSRTAA